MITDPLDRLLEARASFTDMAPPSAALDSALEDMAVQIKRTPYRRRRHRALVAAAISGSLVLAARRRQLGLGENRLVRVARHDRERHVRIPQAGFTGDGGDRRESRT